MNQEKREIIKYSILMCVGGGRNHLCLGHFWDFTIILNLQKMNRVIFKSLLCIFFCLLFYSIPAISNPLIAQLVVTPNDTVCPNDLVTISIQNSTGTVKWSTGTFGLSITVNPTATSTYYAIDDFGGANDTLYTAITIKKIKSFIDIHPPGVWCPGDTVVEIILINPQGNVLWSTGETTATIFVSPPATQTYWFINGVGTNCADTLYVPIHIYPNATPSITAPTIFCNGIPTTVILNNPVGNVLWSTGTTSSSISITPSFNSTLYVINDYQGNCPDTGYVSVKGIPADVWLPNAFSPNGDGENETFVINGEPPSDYNLTIYDRWGRKLFTSSDPAKGWDGKFKDTKCPTDVYTWKMSYFNSCSGKMELKSGNVSLMR